MGVGWVWDGLGWNWGKLKRREHPPWRSALRTHLHVDEQQRGLRHGRGVGAGDGLGTKALTAA
jgi:hypothetical protein